MKRKRMTPEDWAFLNGILVALACVSMWDKTTIYEEIVNTAGGAKLLIRAAKRAQSDYDLDHLLDVYTTRGELRKWDRRKPKEG